MQVWLKVQITYIAVMNENMCFEKFESCFILASLYILAFLLHRKFKFLAKHYYFYAEKFLYDIHK